MHYQVTQIFVNELVWDVEHSMRPSKRYICIGTGHYSPSPDSPSMGRVLIYSLKPKSPEQPNELRFKKIEETILPDKVQCIRSFEKSYLLVSSKNSLHRLKIESSSRKLSIADTISLRFPIETFECHPLPDGNYLVAIACQKESVLLYHYISATKQFNFLASDRLSRSPTSLIFINPQLIMASDKYGNIFGLAIRTPHEYEDSLEQSLDTEFMFHTGEPMVKLLKGNMNAPMECSESVSDPRSELNVFAKTQEIIVGFPRDMTVLESFDSLKITNALSSRKKGGHYSQKGFFIYGLSLAGTLYRFTLLSPMLFRALSLLEKILSTFPSTAPVLGHDHSLYRKAKNVLDAEMLKTYLRISVEEQSELVQRLNAQMKESQLLERMEPWTVYSLVHALNSLCESM